MATDICRRLKVSTEEREEVTALVAHHMFFYEPEWTDGTLRRFVRRVGVERLPGLMALREADITGRGFGEDPQAETRELRERIEKVAAEDAALQVKDLAIDGKDVMRILAIAPGRRIGQILERLLERVLDDPALNTREKLEELVRAELPAS
jgi:tRNA nucleotidyltransferase (CCA-adding enzyme)